MSKAFFHRVTKFPPILCRLLARSKPRGPAASAEDIVRKSGLSPADVHFISWKTDWEGIDIFKLRAFTNACGVSFERTSDIKRAETYLRGNKRSGRRIPPNFRHLRKSPNWETVYKPMVQRWLAS